MEPKGNGDMQAAKDQREMEICKQQTPKGNGDMQAAKRYVGRFKRYAR